METKAGVNPNALRSVNIAAITIAIEKTAVDNLNATKPSSPNSIKNKKLIG